VRCSLLFRFTQASGLAMQAASQNQLAAYYMGIPVRRHQWPDLWALGGRRGGVWRRCLLAPITFVHANMGLIGLKAFPAAVVGRLRLACPGAIVGGVIIGVVEVTGGFLSARGREGHQRLRAGAGDAGADAARPVR
jgi:branched-chain amino acid transport system permease protein